MTTAWIVLATIAFYFALLFVISWITGRKTKSSEFFTGDRKTPWYMVAFAMIGASISGVTFISVPGAVLNNGYAYMQMVMGFFVGSVIVALVLIPMFYKMNLLSIYGYLENRFGLSASVREPGSSSSPKCWEHQYVSSSYAWYCKHWYSHHCTSRSK